MLLAQKVTLQLVPPAIVDVNKDGVLDIVVVSQNKKLYALSGVDGSEIWSWIHSGGVDASAPAIADINADGTMNIVFAAGNIVYTITEAPSELWAEINTKLDALIDDVNAAGIKPSIIERRLIDKLKYAKELKDNAKEECEAGNSEGATKKLGVAKSEVESFASMVRITRRISAVDKASFLADSTEIIKKIGELIEYIGTEHSC